MLFLYINEKKLIAQMFKRERQQLIVIILPALLNDLSLSVRLRFPKQKCEKNVPVAIQGLPHK
jgi:hypothetical protein